MTTDKPSIESLRESVRSLHKSGKSFAQLEPDRDSILAALTELESLRAENEALRAENDRLRQDRLDYSAATTTEGLNASEWIWRTGKAERERDAERARADALAASLGRVWALATHDSECDSRVGGKCNCPYYSTPAADLEAHDARVRWEALGTAGVEAIAAERRRQIEVEGWAPEHDDQHQCGELAEAAACYARAASDPTGLTPFECLPTFWPWGREWYKPGNPRRALVKAGALIAAEIDRLDRAKTAPDAAKSNNQQEQS